MRCDTLRLMYYGARRAVAVCDRKVETDTIRQQNVWNLSVRVH